MSRDGRSWLNQKQMAELFAVSKPNISMLIAKIFVEKELGDSVVKSYFTTAADGENYKAAICLADEADLAELKRIEEEAKRRNKE